MADNDFTPFTWQDGATPITADGLNRLEAGVELANDRLDAVEGDARFTDARTPTDGSVTNAKVAVSAAISADKLADGTTAKVMTATERTKLAGIAGGATANAADADLRDRGTHTGQQPSTSISDFTEAVQDAVAGVLTQGTNVTLTYNDAANTLTVAAAGGSAGLDAEAVRDAIGIALVGVGNIAVTVNDAADTITISTSATVNSTDSALRDRSTHTGAQAISTVTGLQTALDGKTAVSVDGVFAASYDIDTSPVTPGDIGAQPADADLTAIAGLTPTNDDVVQRKAGAWVNRSVAQLATDLAGTGTFQAADSDLTAVAGLSPSNDDVLQRKAGAWTNRTIAQLKADLGVSADIAAAIAAVINSAPGALDTLDELAAALGDDANFAATITTALAGKAADSAVVHKTGDETVAGVKTFSSAPVVPDSSFAQAKVTGLVTDLAGKQPVDSDLTTIAALDSATAGALTTDGSGWIRKTYAQLKTALGLVKADVGLGNVDNTSDAGKPVSTAQQAALDAKAPLASPTFTGTVSGVTKTHVGLGNVDNTTDAFKLARAAGIALILGS